MRHLTRRRRCTRARQRTRAPPPPSLVMLLRPSRVVRWSSRARSRRRSAPRIRPRHPCEIRDAKFLSPSPRASSWRTALPEKRGGCACGRSEPSERAMQSATWRERLEQKPKNGVLSARAACREPLGIPAPTMSRGASDRGARLLYPPAARGTPAAPSGRGVRLRRPRPPCHYT